MTPSDFAQLLCCLITVATVLRWRAVLRFMEDVSDGNVERLEREERRAQEASDVLAMMQQARVG